MYEYEPGIYLKSQAEGKKCYSKCSVPRLYMDLCDVSEMFGLPLLQVVQVITPEKAQVLDFGALPWGCVKGMPIALINKSRATVPVRLVISSVSVQWDLMSGQRLIYNIRQVKTIW